MVILEGTSRQAAEITLAVSEREQLERWPQEHQTPRWPVDRARLILAVAEGGALSVALASEFPALDGRTAGHLQSPNHPVRVGQAGKSGLGD